MLGKMSFCDRGKYDWYYVPIYLNSLVSEYVLWNVFLNGDCVCYNDKGIS